MYNYKGQNNFQLLATACAIVFASCITEDFSSVDYSIDNRSDFKLEIVSQNWLNIKLDTSVISAGDKLIFYNDFKESINFDEYLNTFNELPFDMLKITERSGKKLDKELFDIENWEVDERTESCRNGELILVLENENFQ